MARNSSGPTTAATAEKARKDELDGSTSNTKFGITTQPLDWRAHISVHPAADAFPLLSQKELKELAGDIKRNGLQTSIVVWSAETDAKYQLLDGRNRLDALALIDQLAVDGQGRLCIKKADGALGLIDHQHIVGGDPEKHANSFNLHRRHLTPEQRRERIAKLIKEQPEKSDRQIAAAAEASPTTVGTVRAKLGSTVQPGQLAKRVGADGKSRRQAS